MTEHWLPQMVGKLLPLIEAGLYDGRGERPPRRASFRRTLEAAGPRALIAEFKRAAPGGLSRPLPQFPMERFLRRLQDAPVAAFSCLTAPPYFQGSPEDLRELAARDPRPVLFKDFVIDSRQVDCAARIGASALLLLASLPRAGVDVPLEELAEHAHRLGLEVLLELHAPEELEWLTRVPADLVGVNVRNLDSLTIDRETARRTFERLPRDEPILGLSGVTCPEDAAWFWEQGAEGIVVGSGLAQSDEPVRFLTSLRSLPEESRG
jgi:indole-3-glycerol phosphate synthase